MLGKKVGVVKRLEELQPKALAIHCQAHSLSLSVKETTMHMKKPTKRFKDVKNNITGIPSLGQIARKFTGK